MKAYKREDLTKGIHIQLRDKHGKTKAFTVHTTKTLDQLRDILIKFLNNQ